MKRSRHIVKRCRKCQENRPNNPELPVYSWSVPDRVWERIHLDFAGPFEGKFWLVLADALSKWIEVKPMTRTTTAHLRQELDDIFTIFGLPQFIMSDNGPQFISQQFQRFYKERGIIHMRSSPYHPRTNGLAEKLVRTFKSRMSSSTNESDGLRARLNKFLLSYRTTPHSTTGKTPAQLMFGRQIHIVLDNIRPSSKRDLQYRQIKANIEADGKNKIFDVGETVYCRNRDKPGWKPASVVRQTGRYSYIVNTDDGTQHRYHADQIRSRLATLDNANAETGDNQEHTKSISSPALVLTPPSEIDAQLDVTQTAASVPIPNNSITPTAARMTPNTPIRPGRALKARLSFIIVKCFELQGKIVHETKHSIKDSHYDKGWRSNLIEVFGSKWYLTWFLPFIHSPLPGNGIEWDIPDNKHK
ncbi:hypothetical protein evm_010177 [Chilo suppressalis]|nr:hypothetical protein evm_010177 [Chilo suppressalis]